MKTKRFQKLLLTGIATLFVVAGLAASPLVWFPGPSLDAPLSGAATTFFSGGNNLLIGGDSFAVQELIATNAYWTYLMPFYYTALSLGAVADGGMIIVFGGSDGTSSTSTVIGYSSSDGSVSLASMGVARSQLGYAPDKSGNAYAIGGLDGNGQPLSSAECYNQDSGTWAAIASLPKSLYHFPAVFDRTNYIYIFGGRTNMASGTETATVLRYSVSGNSWTAMASMPVAVAGSAAALGADGKIYVVGGVSGGVTTNVVQVYNLASNSWTISTPLPEGLSDAAMGMDTLGRLIVMGGVDTNGNDVSDVWRSQQLGVPDSAPMFTQYPGTNATYQVPYVSFINATGNPQPTYLVVNGPATMQVDPYSGAIIWTPQAGDIGTNSVTIRATNYAGQTNWTFNIIVPNPPPTILTNLTVVSVAENSVTLSWAPESLVVGPVTYRVYLRHSIHDPKGSGGTVWYTQIGSTTTLPMITITGLTAGLVQTYYVVATGTGGTSGYAGISASTLPAPPPTTLRVAGLTSKTITLAWNAPVGPVPVVSYDIIGVFNGVFVQYPLNYVNIYGTTTTITGLAPGNAILWGVAAYDAYGNLSAYDYLPSLVINPVPTPAAVSSAATTGAGGFQFTVQAGAVQTILIQATTNPANPTSWTTIATNPPTSSSFIFTDTNAAQYPMRFYRILAP